MYSPLLSPPQRVSPAARFVTCILGLLALCLLLHCPPSLAEGGLTRFQLGTDLGYAAFVDDSGAKTIEDIAKLPDSAFTPVAGGLALSYTRNTVWLRFARPPGNGPWWLELQPAVLDSVRLYEKDSGRWKMRQAGDRLPYGDRELAHRLFAFQLAPAAIPQTYVFLRIETTSSLYLIASLRTPEAFIEDAENGGLYWGLYFGALIIALLFMLAMVAINRSRPYLALSVALLLNGLHVANSQGFLAGSLWREHPQWGDTSIGILAPLAVASMLWTLREFVIRISAPRWLDRLYVLATVYCALIPASLLIEHYGPLIRIALFLNLAASIAALTLQLRRVVASRSRADGVLALALFLYLCGLLSGVLPLLGLIPASPQLLVLRNGLFVLFALLAGGALLHEVRHTYWNLLAEKTRALETANQTERLLESCVADRTRALAVANDNLANRQALLQQILDTSFVAIFLVGRDGRIALANRRMAEMFQRPMETLVGSDYADLVLASEREPARQRVQAMLANEIPVVDFDRRYQRADGSVFWGHLTCRPFDKATDAGVIGVIADISQRKETEDHERFRSQILEMLAGGAPLQQILTVMVTGIERLHPGVRSSIQLLDGEGRRFHKGIGPSLPDFFNASCDGLEIGIGVGSCGTSAFTGERVIVEDIANHPYWAPYLDLAARAELGACWSQPIRSSSHRVLGTLAIYHRTAHSPTGADIALIEQMARLASIAIEKSQAETRLRESEERYRLLIESSAEGICVAQDGFIRFCNPAFAGQLGYSEKELQTQPFGDFVVATDDGARVFRPDAGEAGNGSPDHRHSIRIRTRHRGVRWFDVGSAGIHWNEQAATLNFFIDITERKEAEDALRESRVFMQHILDSVPNEIAVLDHAGIIVMVNEAWRQFATQNSAQPGHCDASTGVGASYLDVCGSSPDPLTDATAGTAHDGIRGVLDGRLPTFSLEYACHAPQQERWFTMTATPLGGGRRGAVIVHSDISERKRIEEQIRKLAYYDSLTQLANRRLLHDRLAQAQAASKRNGEYGALILLDLDNFKPLNDEHGHAVGDLLLIEVARRLSRSVRAVDTVARLGGDEFVIVLGGLDADQDVSRLEAMAIAEKIRQALARPYLLPLQDDGGSITIEHRCSSSIGVALFQGLSSSQNEILKSADIAMYRAKLSGRNAVHLYEAIPLPAENLTGGSGSAG
ncbi:PAS domain S-box protein [Zoogloea sp. LCSB751]|uniref:PAS domain S-box protein n=1 Tax=Zoogloea sp. LCSB751 TaxID=1965277 RepID=UPI0009A4BC5B|nr:PAS domain S-box protein [Zoogloea sp. LCSB751]